MTTEDSRQLRSDLLRALQDDERYARHLAQPDARIQPYSNAHVFPSYRVYRVQRPLPHGPFVFFVAYADGQPAVVLTGHPDVFSQLGRSDGVRIESPEQATAYATAFLEVTRQMDRPFYIVGSVGDVRLMPEPTPDEAQAQQEFREQYGSVIQPASATGEAGGYHVTAYAIRPPDLERHTLEVGFDGEISDEAATLASGLPLPVAVR